MGLRAPVTLPLLLALALAAAGSAAVAAEIRGERLYVRADEAALRETPREDAPRVLVLPRGHLLVGIDQTRRWVRVAVARSGGKSGWVQRRDLSTIRMDPLPPPAALDFEVFVEELETLNRGVIEDTGVTLFTRIDRPIDDVVHLTASPEWHALPRHARIGNLRVLARRWARLRGGGRPTWVEILDREGDVVLSVRRGR